MSSTDQLHCPCGLPAPADLRPQGAPPVPCAACATPLCGPETDRALAFERGLAGAVGVGSVAAVLWMFAARQLGSDVPPAIFAGAVVVALAARRVAGVRGSHVQAAAVLGFVAFIVLGEFLIFKRALEPWLIALHEAEGATDAFARAQDELAEMEVGDYLHIATSLPTFLAVAGGIAAGLWITRAPRAVTAFSAPPALPQPEPAPELGPVAVPPTDAPAPEPPDDTAVAPTSDPEPSDPPGTTQP